MKPRIEQLKGFLLTFLVSLSMVLSIGLWNSSPAFESLDQGGYMVNPAFGPGKTVDQVLLPLQIQVRLEENKITLLMPFTSPYTKAWDELHKLAVREMTPVTHEESELQALRTGVSIRYQFGFDLGEEQLAQMIRIVEPVQYRLHATSLIVHHTGQAAAWVVLLDGERPVFRGRVDGQPRLFELAAQWNSLPKYVERKGDKSSTYLLPAEKLTVPLVTYERLSVPSETLARSFFIDPTLTRRIRERDGSLILTDGNRTVRISSQAKGIHYSSPLPLDRKQETETRDNSFQRSVEFINEHGGMQGSYVGRLGSRWGTDTKEYIYNEYRNGIPVLSSFTGIHVTLTGNEVVDLVRNVLYLGDEVKEAAVEVNPPQPQLSENASQVFLAYAPQAVEDGKRIQLVPVWVVQDMKGTFSFYRAETGDIWQDTGEWAHGLE
jgi:regulatory protein YycH of two-component signal transduction system YycFG